MLTVESNMNLEGRKAVRVRARQNLRSVRQTCGTQTIVVLKDPITMRYFRLDEKQHFLFGLMDGVRTLAEIRTEYEQRFRPDRLSVEELENFVAELLEGGLVQSDSASASQLMVDRAKKQNRQWWLSLLNIVYLKIPLGNPDRWLTAIQPVARILFGWTFLVAGLSLMGGALALLATHWREFLARLPVYEDFFRLETLAYLWLTFGLVKIIHELGHALCCKRMGAEVNEVGVVFLFFFPTLYCNVTDSWLLPSKWKRMAVSAAGIYVELLLAALATFVWWWTDSGTFTHHLAFAVMLYCSVNTLVCNANPLMRFDGYHVLADWLEAPNLAPQCQRTLQTKFLGWLGVDVNEVLPTGRVSVRFLFWFGLASLVYRWYVTALALFFVYEFMKQHRVPVVGWGLAVISLTILIVVPLWKIGSWLHQQRGLRDLKSASLGVSLAVVAGSIATFFLIPLPMKVRGIALVQPVPEQVRRVMVPESEGFLREVHIRDGQHVKAGDVLAVLANPKLEIKMRVNEADQALRVQQQNAFIAQFADLEEADESLLAGWAECEYELKSLAQEHRSLKEQCDRLTLRAPADGVVMGILPVEEKGKWLAKGAEFCRIGNDDALRALVVVDPADHRLVSLGSQTSIMVHGTMHTHLHLPGAVSSIAQVDAKNIPEALSNRVAGDVVTQRDPATNGEKPQGQHYLVSIHLKGGDPSIQPGVLGRVKIDAESQTAWWRVRRWLGTTLNWGL
jgi:putative peptide zinc metalloprotease protein